MKKLLLITGMPGSGKTTVAKIIGKHGFPVVSMGDAVRQEADARGIGRNILEMSRFMVELRKELGEEAVARLVDKKIEKVDSKAIVVDGTRSLREAEYFRSKRDYKVIIVGVLSPVRLRYSRLSTRNRLDDPRMLKELEERDKAELSVGLGEVLALSDIYIINEGSLNELRENVKKKILGFLTSRSQQT